VGVIGFDNCDFGISTSVGVFSVCYLLCGRFNLSVWWFEVISSGVRGGFFPGSIDLGCLWAVGTFELL
ncbi:hypothetical protein, partial [Rhizobium brockwellii]|uniref:hypothetical protein n=1 Tax=Rhizobium brockwellii TaxID=3019932 RepID=UPI003F9464F3